MGRFPPQEYAPSRHTGSVPPKSWQTKPDHGIGQDLWQLPRCCRARAHDLCRRENPMRDRPAACAPSMRRSGGTGMSAVLPAAMILDSLLGEPRWLWSRIPHPAVLMGRSIGTLEQQFNRGGLRRAKGILIIAALVLAAGIFGAGIAQLGWPAECIAVAILIAHRSLVEHVRAVADGLRLSLGQGRRAVAMIVSRDTGEMDETRTARSAIESLAENLSDGVIAPIFWYGVAGVPGIVIYKMVNTADSMIGYRTERFREFGWAAARLDDVLNLVPARLTAGLIALVGGVWRQWPQIDAQARQHRSPNAGWPEAALAHAMQIALAGPRSYDGEMTDLAWVNPAGRRSLTPADIDAAIAMVWKVWWLALGLAVLLSLIWM